jgi:hypothetical protein
VTTVAGRRLAIVSLHAHRELAPRGERTRRLAESLGREWDVEVVAPPPAVPTGGAAGQGRSSRARRLAADVVGRTLLDKWEPWSVKRLARWRPDVDAALLIGHPFSPVVYAARRLAAANVPYVVDSGDPWVLTAPRVSNKGIGLLRARAAERFVWGNAAGGVLTTPKQSEALQAFFPGLPTLVRPNGYETAATPSLQQRGRRPSEEELRLVHFGMLSHSRLDLLPLLRALCDSGRWRRISLTQFGDDFAGVLDAAPGGVEVERRSACRWAEVVQLARDYDLAIAVGNVDPSQLPSKAIQYLTLPIPRLAVTNGLPGDSLAGYVRGKPGWLTLALDDPLAADRIAAHLGREWAPAELAAPPSEGWPGVATAVAEFVDRCVAGDV